MAKPKIRSIPTRKVDLRGFPTHDRYTITGHVVGDICWECECRVVEIGGPEGMTLAWCECGLPDDHADMEIL